MRGSGKERTPLALLEPDTAEKVVRRRRDLGRELKLAVSRGPGGLRGRAHSRDIFFEHSGELVDGERLAKHRHVGAESALELLGFGIAGDEDDRQIGPSRRASRAASAPFMPGIA